MTYADYSFYRGDYLGNAITEDDFPRLALRASQYLDYITLGKAVENPQLDALKMACCALAEQYQAIDGIKQMQTQGINKSLESGGQELKSETVGPWSRTYKSGGESAVAVADALEQAKSRLASIAQEYLAPTGLLYRGRRCGMCSRTN